MSHDDFQDPYQDPTLAAYLSNVIDWHGYIRFLGLPHLRDNPDIRIDRLYVEPRLAERHISPDSDPDEWPETRTLHQALTERPSLVVLGDPGSGKSTLVSWLAWRFAHGPESAWTETFGRLVPVPLVLRELEIGAGIDWRGLWAAFLDHEMATPLRNAGNVEGFLERGQALILFDGIDEIGGIAVRKALMAAIREGVDLYPECRWLLTSRLVGYAEAPLHLFDDDRENVMREADLGDSIFVSSPAAAWYVAPFTDAQIDHFARNWYAQREAAPKVAAEQSQALVGAIGDATATRRLARVPNLLTMMALIFRVRARLPHGRALLYDEICEAYLESIDEFRGVDRLDYPLVEKKRWLAAVGLRLQQRRAEQQQNDDEPRETREILVEGSDVKAWIGGAMENSGYPGDEADAAKFVDYIGRRSGLLLPRGADTFAFMHLSFQEYFAACALEDSVTSPGWLRKGETADGITKATLQAWTRDTKWRETFISLFERLASRREWVEALSEDLFGADFENLVPENENAYSVAVLVTLLTVNPHSGFTQAMREAAIEKSIIAEVAEQQRLVRDRGKGGSLFWQAVSIVRNGFSTDYEWRTKVPELIANAADGAEVLALDGASGVKDICFLARISTLKSLSLDDTAVSDLGPLAGLTRLKVLYLSRTAISDLGPLAGLTGLQRLYLDGTAVLDLGPLAGLTGLQVLDFNDTGVSDLGPLAGLTKLLNLGLDSTDVSDVGPLAGLTKLGRLRLGNTGVSDLRPLAGLTGLWSLSLDNTGVSDLGPLAGLTELWNLSLANTGVSDLRPLAGLTGLQHLDLDNTGVSDLSPLLRLERLESLSLRSTNAPPEQVAALQKSVEIDGLGA